MKKILALLAVVGCLMFVGKTVWADGAANKTADQSLTGEVVCISCYLGHGATGEAHAKCAAQCFKKGLPIGLKVGDKLYLVVGAHHGTASKMMASLAGQQVTVTGHVTEQDGMSMVEVSKAEKAAASTEAPAKEPAQ